MCEHSLPWYVLHHVSAFFLYSTTAWRTALRIWNPQLFPEAFLECPMKLLQAFFCSVTSVYHSYTPIIEIIMRDLFVSLQGSVVKMDFKTRQCHKLLFVWPWEVVLPLIDKYKHSIRKLWGLLKTMYAKYIAQCQAHDTCSVSLLIINTEDEKSTD